MLNATTITDEQIRALRQDADPKVRKAARCALGESRGGSAAMRRARARCAEILNARNPSCDFRDAHDAATDTPTGNRCGAQATHRIEWADGRYSFGCDRHLEIDAAASVKPIRIVPLKESR